MNGKYLFVVLANDKPSKSLSSDKVISFLFLNSFELTYIYKLENCHVINKFGKVF